MPEKIDRRIGNGGLLLTTVITILILAAGAGGYVWFRMTALSPTAGPLAAVPAPAVQPLRSDEPLTITLFIPADGMLSTGPVGLKRQPDTQGQAREALNAALSDVRQAHAPLLKELAVRGFFLDQTGTAYVDLQDPQNGIRVSAAEELLALYAMVDILTVNFDEIKQVRFLLDGKEAQTLAGHIDLSRTFIKRMDLVKQ